MAATEAKSPQQTVQELTDLLKTYAKQETVDPLKGLAKFVGFGLGAAIVGGAGVILLLIGVLRLLQTETGPHFTGHLTWLPYLITLVVALILALLSAAAITRKKATRP